MVNYIIRRVFAVVPVLAVVALLVFLLLRLTPGDPAAIIAGDLTSQEQLANIRRTLGLDQPLYVQFVTWLGQLLQGDLGTSLVSGVPVSQLIGTHLPPTLALAFGTLLVSVVIAVPIGTTAAATRGSFVDRAVMGLSITGFSVPVFVIGYCLVYVFALTLKLLPVQGYKALDDGVVVFLRHLALPVIALSFGYVALIARITRTSVLETLSEDYVRTARSKGLSELLVVARHALRNAAVPIVTIIGSGLAAMMGGVVVTESVFNIPGIGRLTIDAVLSRDYPVIQGVILFSSLLYVGINLLIDLSYTLLDPRIRY